MNTTKKVSKNFASLSVAEGVTRICAILLFIYVARVLGITSLGEIAFATSLISFFTFFADFGLTTLGIREIARCKEETNSYGTNILLFQILFTLLLIVILSILLLFMPISYSLKVITFFYGLGLIPVALDMSYIFQGHERMEYVLIGKTVTQVAYFILGFALISLFKNVVFIPIAMLISGVGGAVTTYALLKKVLKLKLQKLDLKVFKSLIVTAIPFVISEILIQIYRNVDIVMLQFTRSTNEIGYYSSGYKIVNSVILIISLLSSSFFPLISFYFKHDKNQFKQSLLLFSQMTGLVSIPIATGAIIYARQILAFLYGNQLLAGTDAFKVLLLLVIVNPFRLVIISIIVAADKQKHYVISGIIGTITNVTLNSILIPKYGMIGAGIAIVVTESAVGVYSLAECFRLFNYSINIIKNYFIKPTIAAIFMSLVAFKVPDMFVGIPLAALVYFVVLFLIKGLPENIHNRFNLAIFKQRVPLQSDQLASDSVVSAMTTVKLPVVKLPGIISVDRSDPRDFVLSAMTTVELPVVKLPGIIPVDRSDLQKSVSQKVEMPARPVMKRLAVRLQALQTSTAQSDPSHRSGRGHPADCTTTDTTANNLNNKARLVKGYRNQLAGAYDDAMQEYCTIIRNAPELLDEVISNLRALLKLAPKYSTGYRVLGDAYMHQGKYIQAREAYNEASTVAREGI